MDTPPNERREQLRYDKRISLSIYAENSDTPNELPLLKNVSVGGFCFQNPLPMTIGANLRFRMHVVGMGHIYGSAVVRWIKKVENEEAYLIGMQFDDLSCSYFQKLRDSLQPYAFAAKSKMTNPAWAPRVWE